MFKDFFLTYLLVFGLTACQSSHQTGSGAGKEQPLDGFAKQNYQGLQSAVKLEKAWAQALRFESKWLKLRAQVVLAESYASDCRLSSLNYRQRCLSSAPLIKNFLRMALLLMIKGNNGTPSLQ